jgi:hypothetical protein
VEQHGGRRDAAEMCARGHTIDVMTSQVRSHDGADSDGPGQAEARGGYEQGYQQILASLSLRQRRAVHQAVTSSAIEGEIPDLRSVARLADLAADRISGQQYRAEILAGIRRDEPASP